MSSAEDSSIQVVYPVVNHSVQSSDIRPTEYCSVKVQSNRPELGGFHVDNQFVNVSRNDCTSYPSQYNQLDDAASIIYEIEKQLYIEGSISGENHSYFKIIDAILDIASYENTTQGCLFEMCFTTSNNQIPVLFFLESGCFTGFTKSTSNHQYRYCLHNQDDISMRQKYLLERSRSMSKSKSSAHPRDRSSQIYKRKLNELKKNLEIFTTVCDSSSSPINLKTMFVTTLKCNAQATDLDHRFTYSWQLSAVKQREKEEKLCQFQISGPSVTHNPMLPDSQLAINLRIISELPNCHWGLYPKSRRSTNSGHTHSSLEQQLSFAPPRDGDFDGDCMPKYLPTSIRNRFIHFTVFNRFNERRQLLNFHFHAQEEPQYLSDQPSTSKRQRLSRRTAPLTRDVLVQHLGSVSEITDMSLHIPTVYNHFVMKSLEIGTIQVRFHTSNKTTLLMNDYDQDGEILPMKFIYVEYCHSENIYQCNCATYNLLQSCLHSDSDNDVIPDGTVCLHSKFFSQHKDVIFSHLESNQLPVASPIGHKISSSLSTINDRVVCIFKNKNILKFSVVPREKSCSIVHLQNGYIYCQNSQCQINFHKSSKKIIDFDKAKDVCSHLSTMFDHKDIWIESSVDSVSVVEGTTQLANDDDFGIEDNPIQIRETTSVFNVGTGKWNFGGYSSHIPLHEDSLKLSKNVRLRYSLNDQEYKRNNTGFLTGYKLIPPMPSSCDCGSGYAVEGIAYDFCTSLYTRHVPIKADVFKRKCSSGTCTVSYSGQEDGIFFWSKETSCCVEVGFDFVNRVLTSKISFTAYVNDMSRVYKSTFPISAPFMSKTTFVSWVFSWMASYDVDFRTNIDPWCKHSPKILACDGTHIGISLKNVKARDITRSQCLENVKTSHHRYDRVIFPYVKEGDSASRKKQHDKSRLARKHLKYMAKRFLSKLSPDETVVCEDELENNHADLLQVCPQNHSFKTVLSNYLRCVYPLNLQTALSELFMMLCNDAPVSSVVPYRYLDVIVDANPKLLRFVSPELEKILSVSAQHMPEIREFISYLCEFVREIHSSDNSPAPVAPIPDTYYPPSGIAYYFTEHGQQIRKMPRYSVSDATTSADPCKKKYPNVSPGGWSHLLLYFCPVHGHCYGFHMIDGSEGRKDPFSAAYSYLPVAPEELYYDFACSLEEYSLNREPSYWRNTRFWHDVFHSYNHKCGTNYRSRRITSLNDVDSEICEQFNAFIQCIKYTGTHLSQSHFCFFLQYFINIWQLRKTEAHSKRIALALAGID